MPEESNLLRRLLAERHWKPATFRLHFEQAARRMAAEVGEPQLRSLTVGRRQLDRWIYGELKTQPHPDARRVLEYLFDRPAQQLFAPDVHDSLPGSEDEDPTCTASAVSLPVVEGVETVRRELTDALGSTTVTETSLEDWEQTVRRHGRAYRHVPPEALLADVIADFADLQRLFARWQPSRVQRRLCQVAAGLAGLVSMTLTKLGEHSAARRWSRTARIAADETGDPAIRSWVRAQESFTVFYGGHPLGAVELAEQGRTLAEGTACPGAALAAALEARAHATLGRRRESLSALVHAAAVLDRLEGADLEVSAFGYREAQLRFHEGYVLTRLQDPEPAWNAQERALALYPASEHLDRTLVHLDRATCLAHDGEIKEAFTHATRTLLDLPDEHRSGLVLWRSRQLVADLPLAQRDTSSVRDFREVLSRSRAARDH